MVPRPKIYFACSIRGGGETSTYQSLVDSIKEAGGEVLSEVFVGDAVHYGGSQLPEDEIYRRDIAWIEEADGIIAEVTNPSLGVGYELAYGESMGIPTLTLFNTVVGKKLSAMVAGNPNFTTIPYQTVSQAAEHITKFIASLQQQS